MRGLLFLFGLFLALGLFFLAASFFRIPTLGAARAMLGLSLIHISEPTRH